MPGIRSPKADEERRLQRIVVSLHPPMLFDVVLRLLDAINREFPGGHMLFDDPNGNLVIEVDADSDPRDPDDNWVPDQAGD